MHTGYDNFWMYQNIRHEPILSLSKSDSYSHAVLTDNYRPLPNGGCSNHLNSYLTPQNNVASSHQSDQSRMTGSQCVWPSSVYPMTIRSTYANNFQSPETYYSQSANLNCSIQNSQVQQNSNSRHLRYTNLNFPQMCTDTSKNNYFRNSNTKSQNTKNSDMAISRIRVKDVFSLNNNTFSNSLFENNLGQTYQKVQTEQTLNCATTNNLLYGLETPTEYMNYEKINLHQSNQPCPPYRYLAPEQTKECDYQKFFQQSDMFHRQSKQVSVENQFNFSDCKEMEKNLPSKTFNNNSVNAQLSNPKGVWEADVQNIRKSSCDFMNTSNRVKVQPKKNSVELSNLQNSETLRSYSSREQTNNIYYSDSLKTNERITQEASKINSDVRSQSNCQETLSKKDEKTSLSQVSPTEELRKCRKSRQCIPSDAKYSENQILLENDLVQITVPHTGQSSFLRINNSSCIDGNPNLSLSCLLESKNQVMCNTLNRKGFEYNQRETENNGVINFPLGQVNQGSSINSKIVSRNTNPVFSNSDLIQNDRNVEIGEFDHSLSSNVISSPKKLEFSDENLHSKKHVSLNNSDNHVSYNSGAHSENTLENFNLKLPVEEKSQLAESNSHNDTISKALVIKQENLDSGVEAEGEQFIPKDQLSPRMIKIENNFEDFFLREPKPESPIPENCLLDKTNLLKVGDAENIDFIKSNWEDVFNIKKHEPHLKIIPNALKNAENRFQEVFLPEDNSGKAKTDFPAHNKMEISESKVEEKKAYQSKKNYKSKINREKLDLLIDFLKKDDEETAEINTSKNTESWNYLKKKPSAHKLKKELHFNRNRRKLNKISIVKNKNNSREMISLISPKVSRVEILKSSSRNSQIAPTMKDLDKSEEKFEESSSVIDRNVDFLENCDVINNHFQKNQTRQEGCLISESKEKNISVCKKEQVTLKNCLLEKKSSIQEEDNLSNAMRTFRSLKTHFCMSCDLISSVDSFWINVVSGELRCLNCFKKMMIRTEEPILKPNLEETNSNINSETNSAQKNETNQEIKTGKGNTQEPGFENKSGNCNGLIKVTEIEYDNQKSDDLKEGIKQELKEIINESSESKFTIKNAGEMSMMPEYYKVNTINFSNTSRRQSLSVEDKVSILEPNTLVEESRNESVKNIKWKEDKAHNSSVLENAPQKEVTQLHEKSKEKIFTEYNEVVNETQNAGAKVSPAKYNQLNTLKEKSSGLKTFSLNQPNKEEENTLKERSVSSKNKLSENYKKKNLSNRSMSKSDFKELLVTNKTQTLKEDTKLELTDKSEKSNKKNASKKESISSESIKMENIKSTNTSNQNKKKTNTKEEFTCQNLQISEEDVKKEIRIVDSLDECFIQTCSKENYACHCLEETVRRNSKNVRLDKLKAQNTSDEICCHRKPKISEQTKIKEMDVAGDSKKKSLVSETFSEKHKSMKLTDQSRKRKNMGENFVTHKVRVIEEQADKEIKLMTHSSDKSKGDNANLKIAALELEKQSAKVFKAKSEKNILPKEECRDYCNPKKKETNQASDSSEKLKAKNDLTDQKTKISEHSKRRRNNSRRKSQDECICSKPIVTKDHSKNESKKLKESSNGSRKNSTSKESSKHSKIGILMTGIEESKTKKVQEKTHLGGKITENSHTGMDINTNEDLRVSLNNESEDLLNLVVKKKQYTRMKHECPNWNYKREYSKDGGKNSNKGKEKTEAVGIKKERETYRQQSDLKIGREIVIDLNERKDRNSEVQDLDEQNPKRETVERRSEKETEAVATKEFLPNGKGSEKIVLLTKFVKKTKKLSLNWLNVVP